MYEKMDGSHPSQIFGQIRRRKGRKEKVQRAENSSFVLWAVHGPVLPILPIWDEFNIDSAAFLPFFYFSDRWCMLIYNFT